MDKIEKEERLNWMDIEPLAASLCGKTEDDERDDIETSFYNKFDISLEQFENVMEALWPRLDFGISPLTDSAFIGFSEKAKGQWIVKKAIDRQFIAGVLQWLSADEIKPGDKGFVREITKKGKIEFKITINKA